MVFALVGFRIHVPLQLNKDSICTTRVEGSGSSIAAHQQAGVVSALVGFRVHVPLQLSRQGQYLHH